ncbi:CDP-alcohol phosphatidyltransferase family protein [Thioalkalivibrio nitratireducens]|uniref:CDP-alcohol phosphatidyltransferase family protein n=1 Tax=Thioalkalivibrio nitratireducens TaxID=186931 RepID=UPI00214E2546|nr:CDP-alcohol phosphatidyltransferase family protein [Thioalkalivibrio nitratireducens]
MCPAGSRHGDIPTARTRTTTWILGVYDPACLVTLAGVLMAGAAIALAAVGRIELALVGLMLAGLADLFDGAVARRLR